MLSLRLKTITQILKAGTPGLVEECICQILNEEREKFNPAFQLHQFINNLESDILFQLMSKQKHTEFKNLGEALRIIQLYKADLNEKDTNHYRG